MSETMGSLVSSGFAPQAQSQSQLSTPQGGPGKGAGEPGFPSVFHQLVNQQSTSLNGDALPVDMTPGAMMPLQPLVVTGVTELAGELSLPDTLNPDAAFLPLASPDGNELPFMAPQVAWSGYVAYGDNHGSAAKSFVGNGDQLVQSAPVLDPTISGSIQRSQQQLRDFLALQPQSLTLNTDPALAKQTGDFMEQLLSAGKNRLPAENALIHQTNHSTASLSGLLSSSMASDVMQQGLGIRGGDVIQVTPQHPQWGQQVGDRVHWMVGQGLQQADIRLNPPELGSLEIRIKLHGDQTSVTFTSPHVAVRDAIDAAMPRLREMLEQGGLNLADVNVSSQSAGQQHGEHTGQTDGDRQDSQAVTTNGDDDLTIASTKSPAQAGLGLVDVYA